MTESNEENKTSNVFVMTRPKEGESLLVIQTKAQVDKLKEIEEMFQLCFSNFILNLNKELSEEEHYYLLKISIPSIAYHFYLNNADVATEYLNDILDTNDTEKQELKLLLEEQTDEVSQLSYILYDKLVTLIIDAEERSFNEAIVDHNDFFSDFKIIFDSLPTVICQSIMNTVNLIEKSRNGKTPTKKNSKIKKP